MNVAIIPARGGSKRIPRKNVREFCGRPIIEYAIASAAGAACIDRVIVSTDDEAVAEVAQAAGAECPFRRPAALADDHTPLLPVVTHALAELREQGTEPRLACCVLPTAALLRAADLEKAHALLLDSDSPYCFGATRFAFPVQRALRPVSDGHVEADSLRLTPMFPEHIDARSQDLEDAWHDAGQFYWGRVDAFLAGEPILSSRSIACPLPRERVQDIDTPEDWQFAEALCRALRAGDEPE